VARVNAYEARYPKGRLFEEAEAIRAEAMIRVSDPVHAKAAASAFLRRWPNSPYAPRIAKLAGE
jgi:hypothetical protein